MATQSSVSGEAIIIGPQQFFIYFSDHGVFLFMGHMKEKNNIYIFRILKSIYLCLILFLMLWPQSDNRHSVGAWERAPKQCSVLLPDGSCSSVSLRPGASIREVLQELCQNISVNVAAVDLFLVGGDKVRTNCWQTLHTSAAAVPVS